MRLFGAERGARAARNVGPRPAQQLVLQHRGDGALVGRGKEVRGEGLNEVEAAAVRDTHLRTQTI